MLGEPDDFGRQADRANRGQDFVHIGLRATGDGEPGMVRGDTQEAVVMKKSEEAVGGEIQHLDRVGGPDGRAHRHEVKIQEVLPQRVFFRELAHRQIPRVGIRERLMRQLEEAGHLIQQAVEPRADQVSSLGKYLIYPHAVVFEPLGQVLHAERHFGRLRMDAQFIEETDQVRVVRVVEDDEPGVDPNRLTVLVHLHGVRVAARTRLTLDERDVRQIPQLPRAAQTRDPGADDGYLLFHCVTGCSENKLMTKQLAPSTIFRNAD